MQRFEIAHLREQGVDLIIVPVNAAFAQMDIVEQTRLVRLLQQGAVNAKLAGTVIPVWDFGAGRMGFHAPAAWHPFFLSIDLLFVEANINRELTLEESPPHLRPARQMESA